MSNMNKVHLQGNLVADPKVVGKEKKAVKFSIAVNNGSGEYEKTVFVDCISFNEKQIPVIVEFLKKGRQIIVNGFLIQSKWDDDTTGQPRSKLEVQLDQFDGFHFCGNKPTDKESVEVVADSNDRLY